MKTKKIIIYILLISTLLSIILTGCTNHNKFNQSLTIQSTVLKLSHEELSEAARIIKLRLNRFDSAAFEISEIKQKNQLKITFSNDWKLNEIKRLLTQKGELRFCFTQSREQVKQLIGINSTLFSIVKQKSGGSQIGTIAFSEMPELNKIYNSLHIEKKCHFAWSMNSGDTTLSIYALHPTPVITEKDIQNTDWKRIDITDDNYYVSINLQLSAIKIWADATRLNIGNSIAILLDDYVLAAPVVRSEIQNGKCQVTGNFTEAEAKTLAILMNSKLPSSFEIVK